MAVVRVGVIGTRRLMAPRPSRKETAGLSPVQLQKVYFMKPVAVKPMSQPIV